MPGDKAFRSTPGKALPAVKAKIEIASQQAEVDVAPGDKEAVFQLRLSPGITTLSGRFFDADGHWIGTYYAYVEKRTM